eukprot:758323-Hanusia_phi.AAC.9
MSADCSKYHPTITHFSLKGGCICCPCTTFASCFSTFAGLALRFAAEQQKIGTEDAVRKFTMRQLGAEREGSLRIRSVPDFSAVDLNQFARFLSVQGLPVRSGKKVADVS